MTRGQIGCAIGMATLCLSAAGCRNAGGDSVEQADKLVGAVSDPNQILGFETPAGWQTGSAAASTPIRTQGGAALQLTVSPPRPAPGRDDEDGEQVIELLGAPVSSSAAALAGLADPGSSFSVDVALPTPPPSPSGAGSLKLAVSSPSRKLQNAELGIVKLKDLRPGIYNTVSFDASPRVRKALAGAGYGDLVFRFELHAPHHRGDGDQVYRFDNLRVHSPATPPPTASAPVDLVARLDYAPPASTPGFATFPVGVVQVPQNFHVKLGKAGAGSVQLELGFASTTEVTCSYAAGSDGSSYVFSSCSKGALPGDLTGADFARLTILGGDASAGPTKIRAQLALNPAGDAAGAGVIPPMPTFWGDDPTSSNQIINDFFNAANATPPTEERWIHAPVPEFARRGGTGAPYDNLKGPPPPNDPPFDQEGHMSPGNSQWDAYWRLNGALSWDDNSANHKTTHFDSELSAHAVIWGNDITIVKMNTVIDTNSGEILPGGFGDGQSISGDSHFVLFTDELPHQEFNTSTRIAFAEGIGYQAPPIQIWIFEITVGVFAEVGLSGDVTASNLGFDIPNWTPYAQVGVSLNGGVNLGIASGGLEAEITLLKVSTPVQISAYWNVNTSSCNAQIAHSLHGRGLIETLGGKVDLVATLGICPFCIHGDLPIFAWDGITLADQPLVDSDDLNSYPLSQLACTGGGNPNPDPNPIPDPTPPPNPEPPPCDLRMGQACGCHGTYQCNGLCGGESVPSCPAGWEVAANDSSWCELHETTGAEIDDVNFTTLSFSIPLPTPKAHLYNSYLRIDYAGGGCSNDPNSVAIHANCATGDGELSQADTGWDPRPDQQWGKAFYGVGSYCTVSKGEPWTPLWQGTCYKKVNLDAYWRISACL